MAHEFSDKKIDEIINSASRDDEGDDWTGSRARARHPASDREELQSAYGSMSAKEKEALTRAYGGGGDTVPGMCREPPMPSPIMCREPPMPAEEPSMWSGIAGIEEVPEGPRSIGSTIASAASAFFGMF